MCTLIIIFFSKISNEKITVPLMGREIQYFLYRGADKFLARPTFRCIVLFKMIVGVLTL